MSSSGTGKLILFGGFVAAALAVVAVSELVSTDEPARAADSATVTKLERWEARGKNRQQAARSPSLPDMDEEGPAEVDSVELGDDDPADVEWDRVPRRRRIDVLRDEAETAISMLERGEDPEKNAVVVEQALASLRADMYGTPSGRDAHRALEERLVRAVDGEPDESTEERHQP